MSKFNLTMSIVIVAAIAFFGFGIFQKANYTIAAGDTVYISYSIASADETYEDQSATVVIGNNTNQLFTDEILSGIKNGSELNFDAKLTQPIAIDETTTLEKGAQVTVEGKITDVTPKATEETTSEATSETASETK